MSIASAIQSTNPGAPVALFRLDTTSLGGDVRCFTQSSHATEGVTFGGQYYTPVDVEFSGLDISGQGSLPTPKLKLANSNGVWQALLNSIGDLVGCTIYRIRTFEQFLDGGAQADSTALIGPDIFRVERKSSENPTYIEWELSSSIDNEGKMLPGRVVVRDTCLWRYRRWNPATTDWDYSKAQCPYTGAQGFDINNTPCATSQDLCARTLTACKTRFGSSAALPFGGFPGVSRVKQ